MSNLMDREQLVEAMALAMANVRRAACKLPPLEYLTTVKLHEREALIAEARAALAVAEAVVRADCARIVNEVGTTRWHGTQLEDACDEAAAVLRTGGTP